MSETAAGKTASTSKTIWAFGVTAIVAIVTLLLHYTGAEEVGPAVLGGAFTALGTSVLGIVLRLVTKEAIDLPDPGSGPSVLLVLLVLLLGG